MVTTLGQLANIEECLDPWILDGDRDGLQSRVLLLRRRRLTPRNLKTVNLTIPGLGWERKKGCSVCLARPYLPLKVPPSGNPFVSPSNRLSIGLSMSWGQVTYRNNANVPHTDLPNSTELMEYRDITLRRLCGMFYST